MYNLPPGYIFQPTEEELITHYLLPKVAGQPLRWDIIPENPVYGENSTPWAVLSDNDPCWQTLTIASGEDDEQPCKEKRVIYVFARLNKQQGKKRVVRQAGCGSWDGRTVAKNVINTENKVIGKKRMLNFEVEEGVDVGAMNNYGHWIMYEYTLAGVSLDAVQDKSTAGNYVVCKIERNNAKPLKRKSKTTKKTTRNLKMVKVTDAFIQQQEEKEEEVSDYLGNLDPVPLSYELPRSYEVHHQLDCSVPNSVNNLAAVEWAQSYEAPQQPEYPDTGFDSNMGMEHPDAGFDSNMGMEYSDAGFNSNTGMKVAEFLGLIQEPNVGSWDSMASSSSIEPTFEDSYYNLAYGFT